MSSHSVLGYSSLSYGELIRIRSKGYRNGNWRRLADVEKGLFKASTELARQRGKIVCPSLLSMITSIIYKLFETVATRTIQFGREKAAKLLDLYGENGVLTWLPSLRDLFEDPGYLLWLGTKYITLRSIGDLT